MEDAFFVENTAIIKKSVSKTKEIKLKGLVKIN